MRRRFVVEADGGSRGNPGPAGYGALVRDGDTAELLAEVAEAIGTATNNVAEYEGLVAGLKTAIRIDPNCVIDVRMDSKLVVEQMSGRWAIKHEDMRRLAAEARDVLPPSRVRYTWIPRADNAHADRLANEAMDGGHDLNRLVRPSTRETGTVPSGGAAQSSGPSAERVPFPGSFQGADRGADLGEPMTAILVRHARTDDTDQGRARGRDSNGPALNSAGERHAQQLAQVLADHAGPGVGTELPLGVAPWAQVLGTRPVAVVTSPLLRARQTAMLVSAALGLQPEVDDDWAEMSLGDWDGLKYTEITARWPAEFRAWGASTAIAPPHGESLDDVAKRAGAACDRLVSAHPGQTVVVVSHTAPIRTVIARALEAGPAALWRLRIQPAAVSVVRFWVDGGCEVSTVNSAAHLA